MARIDWISAHALLVAVGMAASAAPLVVSPEVTADRRIALRVLAPQAQAVRLKLFQ